MRFPTLNSTIRPQVRNLSSWQESRGLYAFGATRVDLLMWANADRVVTSGASLPTRAVEQSPMRARSFAHVPLPRPHIV
jgi:hypothetical protein